MKANRRVLVDVDTQFDFMDPAGGLYVRGAERIVSRLEELFAYALQERIPVLSSVDAHTPNDPEFREWPPHCVIGTSGQKKVPVTVMERSLTLEPTASLPAGWEDLLAHYGQIVFPKSTLNAFDNPHFRSAVKHLADCEFLVFGVATDYCVDLAARGLLERGCRVALVQDAIRAVAPDSGERTCGELTAMGAKWITTQDLLRGASVA